MLNKNWIEVIGLAATVLGGAAALVAKWVDAEKLDAKIEEKVNEAIAEQNKEEES